MNSFVEALRGNLSRISFPVVPPNVKRVWTLVRQKALKHRKPIAVVLSLLLHVAFVLALLPHPAKGLSGGGSDGAGMGAGTGEAYAAVDLYAVSPAPVATTALKTPEEMDAEALDTPADIARSQADTVKTADVPKLTAVEAVAAATPVEAAASAQPAAAMAGAGHGGTTAGTGDDLWAAIAPCWHRVAGADTLPVTLEITFAANGGLSKPPVIDRAAGAPITPQSLQSEARALSALASCGAYPMAAGRSNVKVDFPAPG